MSDDQQPEDDEQGYDSGNERALIGAVIMSPDLCRQAFMSIAADDWFDPTIRHIADIVRDMLIADESVEAVTVLAEAQRRGMVPVKVPPGVVLKCVERACQPESAPLLAQRIRDLSATRMLWSVSTRAAQRMESAWQTGVDAVDLSAAVAEMRRACADVEHALVVAEARTPPTLNEFLSQREERSWLVPGLLERMERIVLTGSEGLGKSWLCAQVATALCGGLHPFTAAPLGARDDYGIRVLVVDCENSAGQTQRRFGEVARMVDTARDNKGLPPSDWRESMHLEIKPAGIDLLDARDVGLLEHWITATNPHLLVLGPLYKLHHADPNKEDTARELAWVLDGIRERHGVALMSEAHAGNASDSAGDRQMRPIGSSLWRRWPEFGFGLRRAKNDKGTGRAELVDVVSWRGSREERAWPSQLQHSHILPWMPADPDYYLQSNRISGAA